MKTLIRAPLALAAAAPGLLAQEARADIITDGTAGAATTLTGPDYVIDHTLGTTSGANLFHSFDVFDINLGESATFTGPTGLDNVISRVTGGDVSHIDGTLTSTVPGANFYFINPAGVMFGAGAQVNVPAGFHVSTADQLNFGNGDVLLSAGGPGSTFSSAAPQSFGFLGAPGGTISFDGAQLSFGDASPVSVTAGDIAMAGQATIESTGQSLVLAAAGESALTVEPLTGVASATATGAITLDGGGAPFNTAGLVMASPGGAGATQNIVLRGQDVTLTNSATVRGLSATERQSANVTIEAAGTVSLSGDSYVASNTYGGGGTGDVTINAANLTILDSSGVDMGVFAAATGDGGTIRIDAGDVLIDSFGGPSRGVRAQAEASGTGGSIDIDAASLTLRGAQISTLTQIGGGDAGDIDIDAGSVLIEDNGFVFSGAIGANAALTGAAGDINVSAGSLTMNGGGINSSTVTAGAGGDLHITAGFLTMTWSGLVAATTEQGAAGDVVIDAGVVDLTDSSVLSSAREGSTGAAGAVSIGATTEISLLRSMALSTTDGAGHAGNIAIASPTVTLTDSYVASGSGSNASGDAGDVVIDGDVIAISGRALPTVYLNTPNLNADNGFGGVSSTTTNAGAGGDVRLTAATAIALDGTQIVALREEGAPGEGVGAGGSVFLTAPSIDIGDSMVSTFTTGLGASGDVVIEAAGGAVSVHSNSGVSAATLGPGDAGDVRVNTGTLSISGDTDQLGWFAEAAQTTFGFSVAPYGSGLSSSAAGPATGAAGSVQITADTLSMTGGAFIVATTAAAAASAGGVSIDAGQMTMAGPGAQVATTAEGGGEAGDIAITADLLHMAGLARIASDGVAGAHAGGIDITAGVVTLTDDAPTTSQLGTHIGSRGGGPNAAITLTVDELNLQNGAIITSELVPMDQTDNGDGGAVTVTAATRISIVGNSVSQSSISSDAIEGATHKAGGVSLSAPVIELTDAIVTSRAQADTQGDAGAVTLTASAQILLNRAAVTSSTDGAGNAGAVTLAAPEIAIVDSTVASGAGADASGDGGAISITATGLAIVGDEAPFGGALGAAGVSANTTGAGRAGDIEIAAQDVLIETAEVSSNSSGAGAAGSIGITADTLTLTYDGSIQSITHGSGAGGDITINARETRLENGGIEADSARDFFDSNAPLPTGDAGSITITGESLTLLGGDADISATTEGSGDAGSIVITMTGDVVLDGTTDNSAGWPQDGEVASIGSQAIAGDENGGDAGSITITARDVTVTEGWIRAYATDYGNPGSITLNVRDLTLAGALDQSRIDVSAANASVGGAIDINARNVTLTGSSIQSTTTGPGVGGNINIDATGTVLVGAEATVGADTYGQGDAGDIAIAAASLVVDGVVSSSNNDILGHPGVLSGRAGGISILADTMSIAGTIASTNYVGQGGGSINIAGGSLSLIGGFINMETTTAAAGGSLSIELSDFYAADNGYILTQTTLGGGSAGNVTIAAPVVTLANHSVIGAGVNAGDGTGGSITINTGALSMSGFSELRASTNGAGAGGGVTVTADTLEVIGSEIAADTTSSGAGGDILINAGSVLVDGDGVIRSSVLDLGFGAATGDGGDVTVNADDITVVGGASITTRTESAGRGGALSITTGGLNVIGDFSSGVRGVTADAFSSGDAGSLSIVADAILVDGSQIASGTIGDGDGGAIDIQTGSIVLRNSGTIAADSSGFQVGAGPGSIPNTGKGGSISIAADSLLLEGGVISGGTQSAGDGGNLTIGADTVVIDGGAIQVNTYDTALGDGGSVTITADIVAIRNGGSVSANSFGHGQGGAISISARDLDISGAQITSESYDVGAGGRVTLTADALALSDFAEVSSIALGAGDAGSIAITAGEFIAQDSLISAGGIVGSSGAGGDVSLTTTGDAELIHADIFALADGPGDGGDILLDIAGRFTARGFSHVSAGSSHTGDTGAVTLRTGDARLEQSYVGASTLGTMAGAGDSRPLNWTVDGDLELIGSLIATNSTSTGAAGDISVVVSGDFTLDGTLLQGDEWTAGSTGVTSQTSGAGNAGDLLIEVGGDMTARRAVVLAGSYDGAAGDAGNISIEAANLHLLAASALASISSGAGSGGTVSVQTGELRVMDGSVLLTSAELSGGEGPGGDAGGINVVADDITISGATALPGGQHRLHSNIGAFAGPGAGRAGNVSISTGSLRLLAGGQITAFSNNAFDGGTVTIDAETVEISGAADATLVDLPALYGQSIEAPGVGLNSALIADTFASGAAGTIIVRAQNISLLDGGLARSNTSSSGRGGTIIICADGRVFIDGVGSALLSNSSEGSTGDAGLIGVQAQEVALSKGGRVTVASAGAGQGGQIVMQARKFDMSNEGGSSDPTQATAINTLVSGAAGAASVQGAGQVTVFAGEMKIAGGSVVTTDTTGAAPAGRIVIRAGTLDIEGETTVVTSAAQGANKGNAGVIDIGAYNLEINDAKISTLSESGSGGQVLLSIDNQLLLVRGEITTQVRGSTADSNAGNIYIGVKAAVPSYINPCEGVCDPIDPFEGVTRPNPQDGVPENFVNEGGRVVASAEVGRGGAIAIQAVNIVNSGEIIADPDSFYDVGSASGLDGVVRQQGAAFVMPDITIAPDDDYRSMCEAQQRGDESRFVEALGRAAADPMALGLERFEAPGPMRIADAGFAAGTAACAVEERAPAAPEAPRRRWYWPPSWWG